MEPCGNPAAWQGRGGWGHGWGGQSGATLVAGPALGPLPPLPSPDRLVMTHAVSVCDRKREWKRTSKRGRKQRSLSLPQAVVSLNLAVPTQTTPPHSSPSPCAHPHIEVAASNTHEVGGEAPTSLSPTIIIARLSLSPVSTTPAPRCAAAYDLQHGRGYNHAAASCCLCASAGKQKASLFK